MLRILYIVVLLLPIAFQTIYGSMSIRKKNALKFWQVGAISIAAQLAATYTACALMATMVHQAGRNDGLPIIGTMAVGAVLAFLIMVLALLQYFVYPARPKNPTITQTN